jgi:RHS repeat-associated protein
VDRARAPQTLSSPRAFAAGVSLAVIGLAACHRSAPETGEPETSPRATALLSAWRGGGAGTLLPAGAVARLRREQGELRPEFTGLGNAAPARVRFPARATGQFHLEDAASGARVGVALVGARDAVAEAADGYVIYRGAHLSGAALLHRALPEGTEDLLAFEGRPAAAQVEYEIELEDGVSGLRLVSNTLEMVDSAGAPRLRVETPFLVGTDGTRTDALLAVAGCAVDTNPAGPWGRPVTAPGAGRCTLQVSWPSEKVHYPAILDPRWTTVTGTMAAARQDHVAVKLTNNKVLVATGRSSSTGTTGLATADLYDPATGTWATTGAMTGGRWSATGTLLNTGKVLVAGGINGTASLSSNTGQLYDPTAGTWASGGNIGVRRHLHTATLLSNGNVLIAGGMTDTAVVASAAIYNPSANGWSAVPTNMASARRYHSAVRLSSSNTNFNTKVLIVGGNSGGATSVASVQLFNSGTLTWETTTALGTGSEIEGHTATALTTATGNVLITGGTRNGATQLGTRLFTIPATGAITTATWVSAGNMTSVRKAHTATLLASGILPSPQQVLVIGGSNSVGPLNTAEVWTSGTTWTPTTVALPANVQGHTATLLTSGKVLIAGGNSGTATVNLGRVYDSSFGLGCTSNSQCTTGFCVDGVCCDTACNNNCDACNLPNLVGTCSPSPSGTTCRAATGACDVAEVCNGSSVTCPADALAPATTTCRAAAPGGCDVAEACTGTSSACPADGFAPATTTCRAAAPGGCDVAETCTGTSGACPADGFAPPTTTCRAAAGACDLAETCTGSSAACPVDGFAPATTTCRAAAPGGCDVAEACTGSSATCPTDAKVADNTSCNDNNACTQADSCHDGQCSGTGVVCAAADQCHQASTCNPATGYCSESRLADGTSCSDGNRCSVSDTCRAGTCMPGPDTGCSTPGTVHYASIVDLGSTQGFSFARGINNVGDIVGTDTLATNAFYEGPTRGSRAFRWSDSEGLVYLSDVPGQVTSYGVDINDARVISGSLGVDGASMRAYRYDSNTSPWPQYQAAPGFGRRVNESGTMTGASYFSAGLRMFRLGTGTLEELPAISDPVPGNMNTWANDIATDGTLVGAHVTAGGGGHVAVRYSASRGTEELNALLPAGSGWNLYEAFGISQQTIVGWGYHDGLGRAFRLTLTPSGDFAGIVDLGLPAPYAANASNIVVAHKSSASGEVVGAVYDQSAFWPATAFVHTSAAGMLALGSLVDPQSGWDLRVGFDINDNHQVVGYGYHNGQPRAFRMTLPDLSPCPPPTNVCQLQGTRDPLTGACSYAAKPDNTVCDDGSDCTGFDACHSGTCSSPITNPACVAPAWVGDAKQAGLLPSGYLTPTIYPPIGDAANININDPTVETHLAGATANGLVAGATALLIPVWPDLAPASPFIVDATGQHLLANPWPGGNAYATGLTEAGEVLVWGVDSIQQPNYRSAFFHPDRSYEEVPVPANVRMEILNNVHGTTGWPTMLGSSPNHGGRAGTLGVWHLDHNFNDAVGPSHFPALANPVWVEGHPGNEAGGALSFNGTTCLTGPNSEDTAITGSDMSIGLTMTAWVKPDPTMCAAGGMHMIYTRGLSYELALNCNPDGTSSVMASMRLNASVGIFQSPAGVVQPGQWSHVAVSWDHKTLQTYVNGVLVGTQAVPGTVVNVATGSMSIGCSPDRGAGPNFKGVIDEVATFRNGMGPDQLDLYRRDKGNYPGYNQNAAVFRYKDGFLDAILPASGAPYSDVTAYFGPQGLNDQGVFIANRQLADGSTSAMLYDPASGWTDLNARLLPDSGWNLQYVYGLSNNTGFVVGRGLHDGAQAGYRLNLNTNEIVDVGRLEGFWGASDLYVYALSVNDAGLVGGAVYDNIPFWASQAFVYTDDLKIFDPNWLIDPRGGWTLLTAGVNNQGLAAGWAVGPNNTKHRGYTLQLPILPSDDQVACAGKAENEGCDDHDPCTHDDKCVASRCSGSPVVCTASDQCHNAGTCDPATGACSNPAITCTGSDRCHTVGACDPLTGCPAAVAKLDGSRCDDGAACTTGDICLSGTCAGAVALACTPQTICDAASPEACCTTAWPTRLTNGPDTYATSDPGSCVIALTGDDIVNDAGGSGTIFGGDGDDTLASALPTTLYGGNGNDHLTATAGPGSIIGGAGDDVISAAGGYLVVPGPGRDSVTTDGNGNTVALFDTCELEPGESLSGGPGDTLITPINLDELLSRGIGVTGFTNIVVAQNSCRSSCVAPPECSGHGSCIEGTTPGTVACLCSPGYSGAGCSVATRPSLVGTLDGALSTTAAGQAAYSIPLAVPVGVAGLQPSISLQYNSGGSDGPAGIGWAVGGISSIARCPQTEGQDGTAAPFDDSAADRFCLDGLRLVAIAGDYGADGTEYRTELETFSRIVSHGNPGAGTSYLGPSTFELWTPSGQILTFGEGSALQTSGAANRRWSLSSIRDRDGNRLSIEYVPPSCSNGICTTLQPIPSRITYDDRTVEFFYTVRTDTRTHYERGLERSQPTRLVRIAMSVGTSIQWSYRLQYVDYSNLSHLDRVSECAGDGFLACKPATVFTYDRPTVPGTAAPLALPVGSSFGNGPRSGTTGNTVVLDQNGDGRDDLLYPRFYGQSANNPVYTYRLRHGTTDANAPFDSEVDTGYDSGFGDLTGNFPCFSQNSVIDFNHDGKDDLVSHCLTYGVADQHTWVVYVAKEPGAGTPNQFGFERQDLSFIPHDHSTSRAIQGDSIYLADLDGDGLRDILSCETTYDNEPLISADAFRYYRNLGPGNGFAAPMTLPKIGDTCHIAPLLIDVDGDRVVDVVRPERNVWRDVAFGRPLPAGTQMPWKALVGIATTPRWIDLGMSTLVTDHPSETDEVNWFLYDPKFLSLLAQPFQTKEIDYNGDGLQDLLQFTLGAPAGDELSLWINTGKGFVRAPGHFNFASPIDTNYAFFRSQILDWNGDGLQDIVMPEGDSRSASLTWTVYVAIDPRSSFYTGDPFLSTPLTPPSSNLARLDVPLLIDHDGDGDQELLIPISPTVGGELDQTVSMLETNSSAAHRLTDVVNGLGRHDHVDYASTGTNGPVYSTTRACAVSVHCPSRVAPLVSAVHTTLKGVSTPESAYRSVFYSYRDATIGLHGRGWLGFTELNELTRDDRAQGSAFSTQTLFDQQATLTESLGGTSARLWYPFAGLPTEQTSTHYLDQDLDGALAFRVDVMTADDKQILVSADGRPFTIDRHTSRVIKDITLSGTSPRSETDRDIAVDGYGNTTGETITLRNGAGDVLNRQATTTSVSVTDVRRTAWLIRLADTQSVLSETDEGAATVEDSFTYYPDGRPQTATREPSSPDVRVVTSFAYDARGNLLTTTQTSTSDGSRRDAYFYDTRGLPYLHIDAVGNRRQYTLDPARGTMLREIDPNGIATTHSLDGFGRLTAVVGPQTTTTISYDLPEPSWNAIDGAIRVTTATAGGDSDAQVFDSVGRAVQSRRSGLLGTTIVQEASYDWGDRIVSESRPHLPGDSTQGLIRYTYDTLGRLLLVSRPEDAASSGGVVETSFGYGGLAAAAPYTIGWGAYALKHTAEIAVVTEEGNTTVAAYSPDGLLLVSRDANGDPTQFRYGAFSLPSGIRDAAGNEIVPSFDSRGRRTTLVDPDRGIETTVYSAFDEPRIVTNERGVITLTYDALGRQTSRTDQDGNSAIWRYDGSGPSERARLVGATTFTPDGAEATDTVYGYTPPGTAGQGLVAHVVRRVGDVSLVTGMTYDPFGRVASLSYPSSPGNNFGVRYSYDVYGHVIAVNNVDATATYWKLLEAYEGQLIQRELFGNGVSSERGYWPLTGNPLSVLTTGATPSGLSIIQNVLYVYDARGNMTQSINLRTPAETRGYRYDPLDRLHVVSGPSGDLETVDYDSIGNIRSRSTIGIYSYTSSRPHAVTNAGESQYQYGAAGDQSSRTGALVTGGSQTIDYTTFGMPWHVRGPGGALEAEFLYDAADSRVRSRTGDGGDTYYSADLFEERRNGAETEFVYRIFAGGREVAEVNRHVTSGTVDATDVHYLHADAIGSTAAATDPALGVTEFQYDSFGALVGQSSVSDRLTCFAGRHYDSETGLIDMRARQYDPKLGRFISADPLVSEPDSGQSYNRYSYALNNPLRFVDPSGLAPMDSLTRETANDPTLRVDDYIRSGTVTTLEIERLKDKSRAGFGRDFDEPPQVDYNSTHRFFDGAPRELGRMPGSGQVAPPVLLATNAAVLDPNDPFNPYHEECDLTGCHRQPTIPILGGGLGNFRLIKLLKDLFKRPDPHWKPAFPKGEFGGAKSFSEWGRDTVKWGKLAKGARERAANIKAADVAEFNTKDIMRAREIYRDIGENSPSIVGRETANARVELFDKILEIGRGMM